jgi:hypothetical protein
VRLALGERKSQAFLLKQRKWTEVLVNKVVVFDITPCFMTGQIDWFAQLESGIGASVDQGGNSSGFRVRSI